MSRTGGCPGRGQPLPRRGAHGPCRRPRRRRQRFQRHPAGAAGAMSDSEKDALPWLLEAIKHGTGPKVDEAAAAGRKSDAIDETEKVEEAEEAEAAGHVTSGNGAAGPPDDEA